MMTETNTTELKRNPFGARLQAARESLGLESKDAAAQLRLNEEVILMLEKDCYSSDLPPIFLRGYLRSYGKLLQIPENEIKLAIEPIQPKPIVQPEATSPKPNSGMTSSNYFVQFITGMIALTLIGLVAIWWYTHTGNTPTQVLQENQLSLPVEKVEPLQPVKTEAVTATISLGAKLSENAQTGITATPVKQPAVPAKKAPAREENDSDESANSDSNNEND